ncbi:evolutionarily conserved C-terminal region 5, partial [Striga asiatica]
PIFSGFARSLSSKTEKEILFQSYARLPLFFRKADKTESKERGFILLHFPIRIKGDWETNSVAFHLQMRAPRGPDLAILVSDDLGFNNDAWSGLFAWRGLSRVADGRIGAAFDEFSFPDKIHCGRLLGKARKRRFGFELKKKKLKRD